MQRWRARIEVSVLFNEPKLLKLNNPREGYELFRLSFSALQRAEIAEIRLRLVLRKMRKGFSALQRAEIAEIADACEECADERHVSVLFNEPKLLKSL